MKSRFEGPRGYELLVDALKEQRLIQHDHELAVSFVEVAELQEFKPGDPIVEQGASDNGLHLIIAGEVSVTINGHPVARRVAGESIGEMAVTSCSAPRSATVTAVKPTLVAAVSEAKFAALASAFPRIWKPIAKIACDRLREREKFHRVKNPTPVVFIGSSVEGLHIARAIAEGLKFDQVVAKPWSTPGIFSAGGATLDTLMKELEVADFALFVFGPDDEITSRKDKGRGPRDNVIFELGLFMGRLDRERVLIVREHASDLKIPTDLLGITPVTYVNKAGQDLATAIEPVCGEVRRIVEKLGAA